MVVVDGPNILIPTFIWIYPPISHQKEKNKTHSKEKKKKNMVDLPPSASFSFFFFWVQKWFMIWYDLIWYKSGFRFDSQII